MDSGAGREGFLRYQEVPKAVQQPVADVAQASEDDHDGSPDGVAQQLALLDELQDQVGDLQQEVETLEQILARAVYVLQFIAAVLLAVESGILDFPAIASSLFGSLVDVFVVDRQVGDPGEP